jgi:hypothetical protein
MRAILCREQQYAFKNDTSALCPADFRLRSVAARLESSRITTNEFKFTGHSSRKQDSNYI